MPDDQGFRPEVGSRGLGGVASLKGERDSTDPDATARPLTPPAAWPRLARLGFAALAGLSAALLCWSLHVVNRLWASNRGTYKSRDHEQ